jgi:hypothetical protein
MVTTADHDSQIGSGSHSLVCGSIAKAHLGDNPVLHLQQKEKSGDMARENRRESD